MTLLPACRSVGVDNAPSYPHRLGGVARPRRTPHLRSSKRISIAPSNRFRSQSRTNITTPGSKIVVVSLVPRSFETPSSPRLLARVPNLIAASNFSADLPDLCDCDSSDDDEDLISNEVHRSRRRRATDEDRCRCTCRVHSQSSTTKGK